MKEEKRTQIMQKTAVVWFGALICCALWGSAFPCIKIGYQMFEIDAADTAAQILFAGYRFTLAGILTVLIGSVLNRGFLIPKKENFGKIFKLSMLQTVLQYFFFYVGLANTTGVKASIIEGVNVFVAVLVASLLFQQEKLTGKKIVGCLIGFAGVVIVNLGGSMDMGFRLTGEGFIFLSTVAYAFSSVFLKRYSKDENPVLLSGYQFITGGIIMCAGEKLPSVRELAAEAGINPNTVQRAFAELERLGLIYTQRTSGKFVTEDAAAIDAARRALAEGQTRQYLAAMSALGFDRAALITFLNQMEETKDANS